MKRSEISPKPGFFEKYINLVDDVELSDAFDISLQQINQLDLALLKRIGTKTYAEGKWTVNETLQHITDFERILSYRTILFARRKKTVQPGFDEELLARHSKANTKTIEQILEELIAVRKSTIAMFNNFDEEILSLTGINWQFEISVAGMGFNIIGHQAHHLQLINTHYIPLAAK
ncbi:MAG: DinB family protein [Lacibacter sp.]